MGVIVPAYIVALLFLYQKGLINISFLQFLHFPGCEKK